MKNRVSLQIAPDDPYRPPYAGTFVTEFQVAGKSRKVITYIPEGVRPSAAGIVIFPPSGMSAMSFLELSNWVELADGETRNGKFVLFILEAENGGAWDIHETPDNDGEELDYVWRSFQEVLSRLRCCVYEGKRYLVGYREGGMIAEKFALWNPADLAGIAIVDAAPIQEDYLKTVTAALCPRLHNYEDPDCKHGIKKGEIPLRAWYISSEDLRQSPGVQHWCRANQDEKKPRPLGSGTWEYYRTEPLSHPRNGEQEGYRVWVTQAENASDDCGNLWNGRIWREFLYPYTRWAGEPGGSYRRTLDPVRDLGMIYRCEKVDGWMREWYIHVPKKIQSNPDTPVPLVFSPHGYSCTGEISVGNTNWHQVADEFGFIVIFPTALPGQIDANVPEGGVAPDSEPLPAWNINEDPSRPSDTAFFLYMLKDACKQYPVDRSRVFVTGMSQGSLMTQLLALKHPDVFTAAAPTSGILHMTGGEKMLEYPDVLNRAQADIPIWMFGGEMENWLLDWKPSPENRTGKTLAAWWTLNRMPGQPPIDYSGEERIDGEWHDWSFEKNGIPMIRFTGIDYFPHALTPDMAWRIWTEFFSRFHRDTSGAICYDPLTEKTDS